MTLKLSYLEEKRLLNDTVFFYMLDIIDLRTECLT